MEEKDNVLQERRVTKYKKNSGVYYHIGLPKEFGESHEKVWMAFTKDVVIITSDKDKALEMLRYWYKLAKELPPVKCPICGTEHNKIRCPSCSFPHPSYEGVTHGTIMLRYRCDSCGCTFLDKPAVWTTCPICGAKVRWKDIKVTCPFCGHTFRPRRVRKKYRCPVCRKTFWHQA